MARQLQNHEGETQLKDDLQSDQASKCVVVSLLGRGEEPCDQGNCDKASCTGPESRKNSESDRPINSKDFSYPVENCRELVLWVLPVLDL